MEHYSIKELPSSEQPYELFAREGAKSLSDAQLLAILLRNGTRQKNSLELAIEILKLCGTEGIAGLKDMTMTSLRQIEGVGQVKATQILAACELGKRIQTEKIREVTAFSSPEDIAAYYMPELSALDQEEMHLLFLDTRNQKIEDKLLTRGTVNASLVSTRELFIEALRHKAVHVVMIHNHPSGDPTPSDDDIRITAKVKEAGELLDITLIDHLIIGKGRYVSLNRQGYFQ